jgi:hypothetical protein
MSRVVSQQVEDELVGGVPADATRALHVVSEKLSTALSVEYRVNELILEATDPKNLCMLFPGWQPWLWCVSIVVKFLSEMLNAFHFQMNVFFYT